jgi:hypothetical protein
MDLSLRIPARGEVWLLLVAIAIPVHVRSTLIFLHQVPGYILGNPLGEVLAIGGYVQAVAFAETLLFTGGLLFCSLMLPAGWFRDYFVPQGSALFFVMFLGLFPIHYQNQILARVGMDAGVYTRLIAGWTLAMILLAALLTRLTRRRETARRGIISALRWASPLAALYLAVDAVLIVFVIMRYL